ncbi:hypothetical protein KUTeg_022695 [Tegillarca granosa]|uniref:Uncharacterized protein n=1 Tax=Tegillarca granosa TaxID=220873 RepID=A0ABQ9E537_TEGGR|nr:hypothetical protein KUTeg_022695 [Tegillarca granosa]
MEVEGTQRVPIVGLDDKRTMSTCHPEFDFPLSWNITHSPIHWANEDTQLEYTSKILVPHIKRVKETLGLSEDQKSLCIFYKWYAARICTQLKQKGKDIESLETVDLRLSVLKSLGAQWIVEVHKDIHCNHKSLVYKGFEKAGISEILENIIMMD